ESCVTTAATLVSEVVRTAIRKHLHIELPACDEAKNSVNDGDNDAQGVQLLLGCDFIAVHLFPPISSTTQLRCTPLATNLLLLETTLGPVMIGCQSEPSSWPICVNFEPTPRWQLSACRYLLDYALATICSVIYYC